MCVKIERGSCPGADLQLDIVEVHAHDIREDNDGILGALIFGIAEVGPDCTGQYRSWEARV